MKITLSDTPLLSTQQIGELASTLDLLHKRTLAAIERLNKDIATRKQQIAARWKSAPGIGMADVARFAQHETLASVREIKDNSKAELDKILKEAGAPHAQLVGQREFYDSPAKVLARAALGDPKRTEYLQQLQHAGPAELGHMAQVAAGTRNVALASAVLSLIDRMPSKDRPVGPVELAAAMKYDDFLKVQEYIKLGDTRLQGILVAIRTWNAGKSNPLGSAQLAMRERDIDHGLIGGATAMTDRRAHYPPCHPAMLALAALVAAIQHRCDPFPELEAAAARNGVAVGSEEFDEAAALAGQPYCRALDLYVDRDTKRRVDALGAGMAHLAFLPA